MRKLGVLVTALVLVLGACGDGEDRPGQVTSEDGGSGSGSVSGTGSGSGSGSGTGHDHGHGDTAAQFEDGAETSTVEVTLRDYVFDGVPPSTGGPNVLFEATVSQGEHEIEVLDANGEALGEIAAFKTGTKELALVLAPGTYTLQCLVSEGAKTHAELGMKATLTVT